MAATIAVVGTFDTKGAEFGFLAECIRQMGMHTLTINVGTQKTDAVTDLSNGDVAAMAGYTLPDVIAMNRGEALDVIMRGIGKLTRKLYDEKRINGIVSMGGSAGTMVGSAAMSQLPIGFPKVLVSTIATGGSAGTFFADRDIMMLYSVVDISGLNYISKRVFMNAAGAVVGAAKAHKALTDEGQKPIIAATMFGVTTPCVSCAKQWLEQQGYEVLVFHATGSGGRAMESLVKEGRLCGVLDLTTTEWADNVCGGIAAAGPDRLSAAALCGVPQVVSVGALDMAGFFEVDTVPEKYRNRNLYYHNAHATLMRTNVEENREIGLRMAEQLNKCVAPCVVMLPLKGVSAMDKDGKQLYGPQEDRMLFQTLIENIHNTNVQIFTRDEHINDPSFALAAAAALHKLIKERRR